MSGRGLPSWYKYRAYGPVYEEIRLAEHAVRLGSIDSFDRRGDVIWFDDFEHGIAEWSISTSGALSGIVPIVGYALSGGMGARLTSGSDGQLLAQLIRYLTYPVLGKLGFEIAWTCPSNLEHVEFVLDLYDGTNEKEARIRYVKSTAVWQVKDHSLGWVTVLTGWSPYLSGALFQITKLVSDFSTGKYVRFLVNEHGVDLSAYSIPSAASTYAAHLRVYLRVYGNAGDNAVVYADNGIVTQNEP